MVWQGDGAGKIQQGAARATPALGAAPARSRRGRCRRALPGAAPARSGRGRRTRGLAGGGANEVWQGAVPARSGRGRCRRGPAGGGAGKVWRGAARARSGRGRRRRGLDRGRRTPRRTRAAPATSGVDTAGDEAVPPAWARGIFFPFSILFLFIMWE
jgi:hypothetical protein